MVSASTSKIDRPLRRRGLRLGIVNGVFWSLGHSLTFGTLIIYFARVLGISSAEFRAVLALAALIGLLRMIAPWIIRRLGGIKRTTIATLTISYTLITVLPILLASEVIPADWTLSTFIALWCVFQLLESIGMVTLWSWLGDLALSRLRGRYFGRRESWKLLAQAPIIVATGLFAEYWQTSYEGQPQLQLWGYAIPIAIGGLLLLASVLVLRWMPELPSNLLATPPRRARWNVLRPLNDRRYSRLLLFGCWTAFFAGLMQSSEQSFLNNLLPTTLLILLMHFGKTLGQSFVAPQLGRLCDRLGNRPIIVVSQVIAATGMLFYIAAEKQNPWMTIGVVNSFIAYVGVNIGMHNLMIKLAPPEQTPAYVGSFLGLMAVALAVGNVIGAFLLQTLSYQDFSIAGRQLSDWGYMFYIGWVTQTIAAVLLSGLDEPGARSWSELFGMKKSGAIVDVEPQRHPLD